ncbi:MAG: hypothetical protein J6D54_03115 [Olsenella sp.]|nr:hypothetical protein [Olsenella sp.]
MWDAISVVCDLMIAFAGLLFTVREFSERKKEKNKVEEEKQVIADLVGNLNKAGVASNALKKALARMSEAAELETTDAGKKVNIIIEGTSDAIESSRSLIEATQSLYSELLQNESRFSLSYGFERMIGACRKICFTFSPKVDLLENLHSILVKRSKEIITSGGTFTKQNAVEFGEYTAGIYKIERELLQDLKDFMPYLEEMKLKYNV